MDFTINKPEKLIKAIIHTVQGMSFGSAQKAIRLGKIKVNNKRVKDNINLSVGDIVSVYEFNKSKPTVPIIYEDDKQVIRRTADILKLKDFDFMTVDATDMPIEIYDDFENFYLNNEKTILFFEVGEFSSSQIRIGEF